MRKLSVVASALIASSLFTACSLSSTPKENGDVESPIIANYLADKNTTAASLVETEDMNISIVENSVFSAVKHISIRTGKPAITAGKDLAITDNIQFLNYEDISDYVKAKELPYKIEIENYPRFDKILVRPLDATASKLKDTPISIAGLLNSYLEVQSIAQTLGVPLSADAYSIQQLSKDTTMAFKGKALDFLETLAEQNNLFFVVEDGKMAFRQYDEKLFPITITPLSIEAKSTQSLTGGSSSSSPTASGAVGSTNTSSGTSGGGKSSGATAAKQTISYDIYEELDRTIKNIVAENGAYHLNQASGHLFVRTKRDNMKTIKKIIDNFNEVYSRVIEIDMTIVEVSLNNKSEMGVDLGVLATNLSANLKGAAVAATGSTLTIGGNAVATDSFKITSAISALQQFGNTKVTSKTVSTTINSIPTYGVSSLEKDYISELSNTQGGVTTAISTQSTKKATAVDGLSFHLFPRISPDGKIVLTIQPKLSKHLGLEPFSPTVGSFIQNETRNQKEFSNTVILDDGGIAIIAGITSDSDTNDKQGLPFIGEENSILDFFGGSRTKNKSHSEIVIFVTTHISK